MSAQGPKKMKEQTEVDLIRQAATDSLTASSNERKHKRQRRRKPFDEAISHNAQRVFDVRSADIIFGRGKGYQDHPGNKRMRAIIRQYKEEYNAIHRSRKRDLVEAVYSEITQGGARFLHKSTEEDVFVVVDIPIALQKVRNTLRCKKSGMVPTDDDEGMTSPAAVAQNPEGSLTVPKGDDRKVGAVASAIGVQGLLPLDLAGLGGNPLASQVGLMSPSALLQSQQFEQAMLPSRHPVTTQLPPSGLLPNNLLSQTQFAGLGTGIGGMQLPMTQQQPALQANMAALAGRSLGQGFPLMGAMASLPGADSMLGSTNNAWSTESQNSPTEPQGDTKS